MAACARAIVKLCTGSIALLVCSVSIHSPAARAEGSASLSAETSKPETSTYAPGEPAAITFSIAQLSPLQRSSLSVRILDQQGSLVAAPATVQVIADGAGRATHRFAIPTMKLGYYEVHAQLPDGTALPASGSRPAGFLSYAVVPDPARRANYGDSGSRFGMQGGFSASGSEIRYLGVRYIIQGAGDWTALEPHHPGEFAPRAPATRSAASDPTQESATASLNDSAKRWSTHYMATITRASLPAWAIKEGTTGTVCTTFGALRPAAEPSLAEFARTVARAFHSSYPEQTNRYYQVTWEPADWCFRGSAADLVRMYALSYAPIHSADPGALVAGPTLFTDAASTAQLRNLWQAGLARYIDVLSIHPYAAWPPETTGNLIQTLRVQLKDARQAAGRGIGFIGTEHGYKSAEVGLLDQALGDVRSSLIVLGEGARLDFAFYVADFWSGSDPLKSEGFGYYWNLDPRRVWGTDRMGPKPAVPAYAAMTYFLDGSVSDGPLKDLRDGQVGYRFHRSNGSSIRVLWQPTGASAYPTDPGMRTCDWMGNCSRPNRSSSMIQIGASPTYILDERP
jgi:hypothetical protein